MVVLPIDLDLYLESPLTRSITYKAYLRFSQNSDREIGIYKRSVCRETESVKAMQRHFFVDFFLLICTSHYLESRSRSRYLDLVTTVSTTLFI